MPLVGEVKVGGLTAAPRPARRIADELKKGKYLKNPQVSVALTTVRSRQVSVLGLVARPGRYALDDTSSNLADVIAAAGGIAPGGSEKVTVMRGGKAEQVDMLAKSFACSTATRSTSSARRCSTSTARWRAPAPTASSRT